MSGYDTTPATFGPDNTMTRAQALTALWRVAVPGGVSDSTTTNTTPFFDVLDGQYYTAALNWAYDNGVLSPGNGYAQSGSSVTREMMAVYLMRTAMALGVATSGYGSSNPGYSDWASVSSWARPAMVWCKATGVLTGFGNQFRPANILTRAQCTKSITVLHRDVI